MDSNIKHSDFIKTPIELPYKNPQAPLNRPCSGKGSTRQAVDTIPLEVPDRYEFDGFCHDIGAMLFKRGNCTFDMQLPHKLNDTETFVCDWCGGIRWEYHQDYYRYKRQTKVCHQCKGSSTITAKVTDIRVVEKKCDWCHGSDGYWEGDVFYKQCPQCKGKKQYNLIETWEEV